MELSTSAYVILGMVSQQPRSGYEIKALVDESTRFFWATSYGQIYPELRRLAEAGLIEGSEAPRGKRRRTVYAITPRGEAALKEWLQEDPAISEMREEGLLKLFFAGALPPTRAIGTLRWMGEHHAAIAERLRGLEPKAREKDDGNQFPLMVLRGGIELNERFAQWCAQMEAHLLESTPEDGEREA